MRDIVACLSGIREIVRTQITIIAAKANQQASAKYQSKGTIYILNLLAFTEISLFKCIFGKEKTGFGIAMKKCGMRDSRKKRPGMRDQDPPLPYPGLRGNTFTVQLTYVVLPIARSNRRFAAVSFSFHKL